MSMMVIAGRVGVASISQKGGYRRSSEVEIAAHMPARALAFRLHPLLIAFLAGLAPVDHTTEISAADGSAPSLQSPLRLIRFRGLPTTREAFKRHDGSQAEQAGEEAEAHG